MPVSRKPNGCGSKLNSRGYAGVGPCFHLPGFHFGTGFWSHSQITKPTVLLRQTRLICSTKTNHSCLPFGQGQIIVSSQHLRQAARPGMGLRNMTGCNQKHPEALREMPRRPNFCNVRCHVQAKEEGRSGGGHTIRQTCSKTRNGPPVASVSAVSNYSNC